MRFYLNIRLPRFPFLPNLPHHCSPYTGEDWIANQSNEGGGRGASPLTPLHLCADPATDT